MRSANTNDYDCRNHWTVFTSSDITTTQQRSGITRCLIESATPVRLEIVRITSPKGCCTYGGSMFAPVGRGTPGHPDRDRQRHERPRDRSDARPQRLGGRQGDRTRHVVPVRRERVLPAVPAETAGDGPVDGRMLHRPPPGARPAAGAPNRASATACHANACGRGWPNGRVAAGRRRPSAAGRASCSPTTPPCACARRASAVGSTPTAITVSAGRAAFHAAAGGGAGVAAGGRRVSRFPDGLPSPDARRRPATAAVSAIGRPTA